MTTSNIVPRVTCFDVRAALDASPLGTRVCIDFSTLIGRLIFDSTGNECTCEIARYPIPTLEPSFDNEHICMDPVLRVVAYRLKNFSEDVVVDVEGRCTTCTFRNVKHVDSLTIREFLCEHPRRIQFEADCIGGQFTVRAYNVDNHELLAASSSSPVSTIDPDSVRQLYEVTKRYLKRRRKSVVRNSPLIRKYGKGKRRREITR